MRYCGAYQKRISLLRQFSACPPGPAFPSLSLVAAICLLASPTARSATQCSVPRLLVALALLSRGATAASEGKRAGQQGTASESWTQTFHGYSFMWVARTEARKDRTCLPKATASDDAQVSVRCFPKATYVGKES